MKMRKITVVSAVFTVLFLLTGCVDFEYTGRTFEPIPDDTAIAWHSINNPVPAGKYRIIGRGVLRYKVGEMDSFDVEELLIDKARENGADAVMLKTAYNTIVGDYETDISYDPARRAAPKPAKARMTDGTQVPVNSFGKEIQLGGAGNTMKQVVVYAEFYKNAEAVRKLIESQPVRMMQDKPAEKSVKTEKSPDKKNSVTVRKEDK